MGSPPHQTILSLARAGNPVRAWSLFRSSGLNTVEDDARVLTLKGRLLKDLARRAEGDERNRLYSEASDAYLAANALGEDSYPLINAAALACFAGDHPRASRIARDVLTLIENDPAEGETAYWREATRAEAHLLMREMDQATAALAMAYKKLPFAHEDQAATLGQFDRILEAQGADSAWLEPFRVPCSVNFVSSPGLNPNDPELARSIASALESFSPGYGFNGLLTPADLLFSKGILDCGAELSVALPYEAEDIASRVFAPLGREWTKRFDKVLSNAGQVELLPAAISETPLSQSAALSVTQMVAMGQSLRRSEALRSRAQALVLRAEGSIAAPPSLGLWSRAELPMLQIPIGNDSAHGCGAVETELCGLVLGTEPKALMNYAERFGLETDAGDNRPLWRGTFDAVLDAARECARETNSVLSVHLGHPASLPVLPGLFERMERLARADHKANIKMGMQSAMIAKIVDPDLRIEELGEIQTLTGHASIWSATS